MPVVGMDFLTRFQIPKDGRILSVRANEPLPVGMKCNPVGGIRMLVGFHHLTGRKIISNNLTGPARGKKFRLSGK